MMAASVLMAVLSDVSESAIFPLVFLQTDVPELSNGMRLFMGLSAMEQSVSKHPKDQKSNPTVYQKHNQKMYKSLASFAQRHLNCRSMLTVAWPNPFFIR